MSRGRWRLGKVLQNMFSPVALGVEIGVEIIGKEKKFENGKHDEQFDGDDLPQGFPHHHGAEAVSIKKIHLFWQVFTSSINAFS